MMLTHEQRDDGSVICRLLRPVIGESLLVGLGLRPALVGLLELVVDSLPDEELSSRCFQSGSRATGAPRALLFLFLPLELLRQRNFRRRPDERAQHQSAARRLVVAELPQRVRDHRLAGAALVQL